MHNLRLWPTTWRSWSVLNGKFCNTQYTQLSLPSKETLSHCCFTPLLKDYFVLPNGPRSLFLPVTSLWIFRVVFSEFCQDEPKRDMDIKESSIVWLELSYDLRLLMRKYESETLTGVSVTMWKKIKFQNQFDKVKDVFKFLSHEHLFSYLYEIKTGYNREKSLAFHQEVKYKESVSSPSDRVLWFLWHPVLIRFHKQ